MKRLFLLCLILGTTGIAWWIIYPRNLESPYSASPDNDRLLDKGPPSVLARHAQENSPAPPESDATSTAPAKPGPSIEVAGLQKQSKQGGQSQFKAMEELARLRREARQADRLDSERRLLEGESLSTPAIKELLAASPESFDSAFAELESESMSDPLAFELTNAYSDFMDQGLDGEHGDFGMDRLACGLRICIGESTSDPALWNAALAQWQDDQGPPIYAVSEMAVYDESGAFQGNRIIFTTDPDSNSISVPISYRPPEPADPPGEVGQDG